LFTATNPAHFLLWFSSTWALLCYCCSDVSVLLLLFDAVAALMLLF
jgi:hypothetical protein